MAPASSENDVRLVDAHWEYVEGIIRLAGEEKSIIDKCKHHYKTAFHHGLKHAREEIRESVVDFSHWFREQS